MDKYWQILTTCIIFKGLTETEIENELRKVPFQVKIYKTKETIALSDETCNSLLIVLKGMVKGEMTDFSGKVIRIEELNEGKPLAPAFLFGKNNQYPVDIISTKATTILVIPKTSLLTLLKSNNIILNNYLALISNRAQFLTSRIRFLSFQSIKGKVAQYLLELSKRQQSNHIELTASHNELSELFGVARPSLSRTIRELDHQELIKAQGKKISILNKDELRKLIL